MSCSSQYFIIADNSRLKSRARFESRGFKIKCSFHCHLKCALLSCQKAFLSEWVSFWKATLHISDVSKLMWRTARSDKGMLVLFMPPLRHFNLEMLNILISLFSSEQTADLTLTSCSIFPPQRTAQQAKERSQMRKSAAASKVASDISRFFIKK